MAARRATVLVMGVVALAACASGPPAPLTEEPVALEPERVPDPVVRGPAGAADPWRAEDPGPPAAVAPDEREPELRIECGRDAPYVCTLDDGTFQCSTAPCVPTCERVGCIGSEVCVRCGHGFRCLRTGDWC